MTDFQSSSTADDIIAGLDRINKKVDDMRNARLNDPDSLGDKLVKFAVPSIAGFVAGKAFQLLWNKGVAKRVPHGAGAIGDGVVDDHESWLMSVAFSAASAAFTAVVSQLSNRGSQALVDRRHHRKNKAQ
ncbi:hypothetical protein D2E25_1877 [Bifidobacterium goeldii]|uniref:DUF4235 domain-containing protein n=1 Tax=Bifidobacterium goeldii TaxID=2306975 RepID=A0A430FF05_9BIFI|nr:DUF4235 domain-containing protein [Bifidobacterium goeldii]RSX51322.1 hypothetical protein D2E25_1877 [Bifidobacterium goeldii]